MNFEISGRTYVAEIDVDELIRHEVQLIRFTSLPKYPAVERDIAVVVDKSVEAGKILKVILDNGGDYIEGAELFDVYEGDRIEAGKKSVAYALSFRSENETLTDEVINADMENIVQRFLSSAARSLGIENILIIISCLGIKKATVLNRRLLL